MSARHLYIHMPFCAHRCGYCDFVTAVGRRGDHAGYVDALIAELELERNLLDPGLETIFLGGGTPTFTDTRHVDPSTLLVVVEDITFDYGDGKSTIHRQLRSLTPA